MRSCEAAAVSIDISDIKSAADTTACSGHVACQRSMRGWVSQCALASSLPIQLRLVC